MSLTRRGALRIGGMALGWAAGRRCWASHRAPSKAMTLGFSSYGMPDFPPEQAIQATARIGFDALEIDTAAGRNADPLKLTSAKHKTLRELLAKTGLKLSSLMAHLTPTASSRQAGRNLTRLRATADLARALSPSSPPLIQTVLGGGRWEDKRNLFVDRLGKWLEITTSRKIVLAIKPHRGGALSRPAEAVWLADQLGQSSGLKMVYDYSHYAFRNLPMPQTIKTSLPLTAHIAVKDVVKNGTKYRFALPGESGKFDYVPLLKQFHQGGYRGDISCEVSSQVWRKAGYDAMKAARKCYAHLSEAFRQAKIPRPT